MVCRTCNDAAYLKVSFYPTEELQPRLSRFVKESLP